MGRRQMRHSAAATFSTSIRSTGGKHQPHPQRFAAEVGNNLRVSMPSPLLVHDGDRCRYRHASRCWRRGSFTISHTSLNIRVLRSCAVYGAQSGRSGWFGSHDRYALVSVVSLDLTIAAHNDAAPAGSRRTVCIGDRGENQSWGLAMTKLATPYP
jgi:hypothetical protein